MTLPRALARLLIVDDDLALGKMLSWCFSDLGYDVSLASDGAEAEAFVKTRCFDFALLDFQLPDCDGLQLRQRLQSRQPSLRTAMMSANPPTQDHRQSPQFHLKPVSVKIIDNCFKTLPQVAPSAARMPD